jgi:hypothetical protein
MSNHNGDCPRPTGRPRTLLARHLLPSGADGNNVAFSPLSVHSALSLVATGAKGDTLHQLLDFLGAPDLAACVGSNVVAYWLASGWPKVLLGSGVWEDASCGVIQKYFQNSPYRLIGRALRERAIMFFSRAHVFVLVFPPTTLILPWYSSLWPLLRLHRASAPSNPANRTASHR